MINGNGNGNSGLSVAEIVADENKLTLTVEETAKILRLSKVYTYEQLKVGKIPSYKLGKSKYVISKKQILDIVNGNGHKIEAVSTT